VRENLQTNSPTGLRTHSVSDGITVTGEAMRRVSPEAADFLIEITTSAPSAAQSMRENQARTQQIAHALAPLSVQPADLQSISLHVYNLYSPYLPAPAPMPMLPQFAGPHSGVGFVSTTQGPGQELQHNPYEMQFGAYQSKNIVRVTVRDANRAGEVVDTAAKNGAVILGGVCMRVSDESSARKTVLEAAAKDARTKAEALANAAGKPIGEPVAITEEIVVSNGTYMALRAALPFAFGAGTQQTAGEFEYYARVSARFNFQ